MVQHICEWDQDLGLDPVHADSKDTTAHHRPSPTEVLKAVLRELWIALHHSDVIFLEVDYFLVDHVQKGRSLQHLKLLGAIVDGEAREIFRQRVNIKAPFGL